jgi:hypothetical protein
MQLQLQSWHCVKLRTSVYLSIWRQKVCFKMQLAFYSVVIVCSAGIVASVGVNELIPLSATFANFSAKKLHVS